MEHAFIKKLENNIFSLTPRITFKSPEESFCKLLVWKDNDFIEAFQPSATFKCDFFQNHIWISDTIFKTIPLTREESKQISDYYPEFDCYGAVKLKAISQEEYMKTLTAEIYTHIDSMRNTINRFIAALPDNMYDSKISHFLHKVECEMTDTYIIKQQ